MCYVDLLCDIVLFSLALCCVTLYCVVRYYIMLSCVVFGFFPCVISIFIVGVVLYCIFYCIFVLIHVCVL